MLTGFRQIDGSWYYLPNGIRATGWHNVDGGFRYFGSDGKMLTYWQNIGGYRYYLGANGIRVTGFQTIDGKIYYFDSEGKMQTGWLNIGDDWYYGGQDGALYVGAHEINGVKYLFDSDGRLLYGYGSITISKIGEDIEPNQVFVYKIEGKTAYLDTEISLSFTIVGEGSVTVADIPNGKYTVTEVSACSWRYSATDGKTSEEVSLGAVDGASHSYAHTCVFTSERTNNKWLSSCSNVCQNTPAPPITNQLLNNQLYISEKDVFYVDNYICDAGKDPAGSYLDKFAAGFQVCDVLFDKSLEWAKIGCVDVRHYNADPQGRPSWWPNPYKYYKEEQDANDKLKSDGYEKNGVFIGAESVLDDRFFSIS
jgi:hypothetical protein